MNLTVPIFNIICFCPGWGLTEEGQLSDVLQRTEELTVSDGEKTGFLTTSGGEENSGTCRVIQGSFYIRSN